MPKYLVHARYTADGVRGVIAEGGSSRADAVTSAVEAAGGELEAFYFAFGDDDVVTIIDLPDNVSAAAIAMTIGATGLVGITTTPLLTPQDIDVAAKRSLNYRAPGR
jgi:uncharacterized protein with GYD domain